MSEGYEKMVDPTPESMGKRVTRFLKEVSGYL